MFFDDHPWPHFHVRYAEFRAVIALGGLEMRRGRLLSRVGRVVRQWAQMHEQELRENWQRVENRQRLRKVAPLT
jgi:hypothetical protein